MQAKKCVSRLVCFLSLCILFFGNRIMAKADMGPKPSIRISFLNLGDEVSYGTLLADRESTGPASAWDGNEGNARYQEANPYGHYLKHEIWEAFVQYEDPDGYFFLQEGWQINKSKDLAWTYYPPRRFKLLLYFPESNTFLSSPVTETYAFDSAYTVDLKEGKGEALNLQVSYDYGPEILSLVIRVVLTCLVELLIAFLFGFREKKQWKVLVMINVLTQIFLNTALNCVDYYMGYLGFLFFYVVLEVIVFSLEAVLYSTWLKRISLDQKPGWFYVLFAFVSNLISLISGIGLARILPGIF